jgi:hypothetical protein
MSGRAAITVGDADAEAETISYGARVDGDGRRVRTLRGSLPGGARGEGATRLSPGGGDDAVTLWTGFEISPGGTGWRIVL